MFRPINSLRRSAAAAALLLAPLVTIAPANAATETASSSGLSASFHYTGTYPQSHDPRLTISRSGKVLYNHPVTSSWCANECWPELISARQSALHVVHLDAHGGPAVVLDLYSGGAHCCSVEQVYSLDSTPGRVRKTEHNFGDPGALLEKIGPGGSLDFLSADDAFAYAFTDFAASGMPIQIMSFSNNAFHDVTRSFPKLIVQDANQWRKAFDALASSQYQDTVGIVAAWAADEDMLGNYALVQAFLSAQLKVGHLNSALSPIQPGGQRFVSALAKFLRAHHYVK
jgi:hypothetical protein